MNREATINQIHKIKKMQTPQKKIIPTITFQSKRQWVIKGERAEVGPEEEQPQYPQGVLSCPGPQGPVDRGSVHPVAVLRERACEDAPSGWSGFCPGSAPLANPQALKDSRPWGPQCGSPTLGDQCLKVALGALVKGHRLRYILQTCV